MRVWLLVLLLVAAACAQNGGYVVSEIQINGLRHTNAWVVERELRFQVGDTVTRQELWDARKRLQNLSVFNDVWMGTDTNGLVLINVSEIWPLWPIADVSLTDGQLSDVLEAPQEFFQNATIYAGARHLNFRGNASQVYARLQFGASDGFDLGYRSRWLSPAIPLAVGIQLQNLHKTDPHAAIADSTRYMRENRFSLDIATRGGATTRVGGELRYHGISQDKIPPAEGLNQHTYWLIPYFILEHRDLEWFPTKGSRTEFRLDLANGDARFVRSYADLRGYFPFSKRTLRPQVLALRVAAATSSSNTPSWAHYYYGFATGLRGYRNIKSEAAGFLLGDVELRVPLGPEGYYDVPLIGRYGKHWPWGMHGFIFGQRSQLILDTHRDDRLSWGGGFYLRAPYVDIVELSAAVRRMGGYELTFNTGVAF